MLEPLLPRQRLVMSHDPGDYGVEALRFHVYDQLPCSLLLVGDFWGGPDARPGRDRALLSVDLARFDGRMGAQKLRAVVPLGLPGCATVALRFRRLDDFEPERLAAQIAVVGGLAGMELEEALRRVYLDPQVAHIERIWRSLHLVLHHASAAADSSAPGSAGHVQVEIVNSSASDLERDFAAHPTFRESSLWWLAHQYDHLGMRPFAAAAIEGEVGGCLHAIGAVARNTPLPTLVDAPASGAWLDASDVGFVAPCGPGVVIRPAHAFGPELHATPSFAVAALIARSAASYLVGSHFATQSLPGVEPAIGSRDWVASGAGARLVTDRAADGGSFAERLFVTRLVHQVLNIHYRKALGQLSHHEIASHINAGLARRLATLPIDAQVDAAERIDPSSVRLTLSIDLCGHQLRHRFTIDHER